MSGNNFNFDYDFPEFDFDPAEIPDSQLEHIQNEIGNREEIISNLRKEVIDTETHRKQLEDAVGRLRSERTNLQNKVQALQSERSTSRPNEVFANFSRAVEEVESDLADSPYRLEDFQVEMKANVLQDEEGVKFHLPGVDEEFAAANLSTVNFRVSSRGEESDGPDTTYDPIPDVRGMDLKRAGEVVRREGFSVGTVKPESDFEDGVVVDQFPSPRSIAEPGTTVDLTVSWDQPDTEETDEPTHDDSRTDRSDSWRERLEARLPPLEEVDGIGPTYAERLRSVGIESILNLAQADPERAGDAAHTSTSRAEDWVREARVIIKDITR